MLTTFTLPPGYRPAATEVQGISINSLNNGYIQPDGRVQIDTNLDCGLYLDGVTFRAAN
jgi:hypothetical protein